MINDDVSPVSVSVSRVRASSWGHERQRVLRAEDTVFPSSSLYVRLLGPIRTVGREAIAPPSVCNSNNSVNNCKSAAAVAAKTQTEQIVSCLLMYISLGCASFMRSFRY